MGRDQTIIIRRSVALPEELWKQIDRVRRSAAAYPIPSTNKVLLELVREAMAARAKAMRR